MRASVVSVMLLGTLAWIPAGCRREAPVNGIEGFEIGKTQLGSLSGRCTPEEPLMWCPGVTGVRLGDQKGNIDLYFEGMTTDSRLIEILIDVPFCRPEGLEAFLTHTLGEPKGRVGKRAFWSNEYVYISAALPAEPRRCEVNFVSVKDQARIDKLSRPAATKPPEAKPAAAEPPAAEPPATDPSAN